MLNSVRAGLFDLPLGVLDLGGGFFNLLLPSLFPLFTDAELPAGGRIGLPKLSVEVSVSISFEPPYLGLYIHARPTVLAPWAA
jgi:hypothetical protein